MLVSICDYSEGLNKSNLKVLPLVEQLASISMHVFQLQSHSCSTLLTNCMMSCARSFGS